MNRSIAIEICVGDVESAIAAEVGGADRVELCDNLAVGGTTPSAGTIAEACRWLSIPVHVLIRPRAGDFVHGEREIAVVRRDIEAARALGAAGVVLGVLDDHRRIATSQLAALIELARPLSVTFHRAIDVARDPLDALDRLIELGVDRVLSSGGRPSAAEGAATLRSMVDHAGGRIAVMAGGRVSADNADSLIRTTGVREIHVGSAAARFAAWGDPADEAFPPWSRTDARLVQTVVEAVRNQAGRSPG